MQSNRLEAFSDGGRRRRYFRRVGRHAPGGGVRPGGGTPCAEKPAYRGHRYRAV